MTLFRCVLTASTILAVAGSDLAGSHAHAASLSETGAAAGSPMTHKAASSGAKVQGHVGRRGGRAAGLHPARSGRGGMETASGASGSAGQAMRVQPVTGATASGGAALPAARAVQAAQQGQPSVSLAASQGLPEVVTVSALRRPVRAEDVGSSVTVVTDEQIAIQQRRTLPDILARQPGLNVVRSGGFGGTTSIFMRGANANDVKVRIDGMDVNDGSSASNAFDAGQFVTDGIGSIEILRGPQSGLYGADAMAGVIDINTKAGEGRFKPFARIEGGSYGTFNQALGASGRAGRFHYNVALSHYRIDGFHEIPRYIENENEANRAQRRAGDRNDNRSANVKLGYDVTRTFDLGLTARLIQANYHTFTSYDEMYTPYNGTQLLRDQNTQNEAVVRGTAHLSSFGGRFDQVLGLGYMTNRRRYMQDGLYADGSPAMTDPDYYRSTRLKVDWHGTLDLRKYGTVLVGAEHFHDSINVSTDDPTEPVHTSAGMDTTAGYGQYEGNWNRILYGAANVRYDANSRYGNHVTWRVAPAIHVPHTGTILKASAGSGFHAPSLYQLFVDQRGAGWGEVGNPALKAETMIGYDVGVEQKLLHDKLRFGATWYDNKVRNLIQSTGSLVASDGAYQYLYSYGNTGHARMYGVEAFLDWKALETLSFALNYTWTHARDTENHALLQRRPQHKFNFNTTWSPVKDFTLSGNILYTSGWRDYPLVGENFCPTCAKGHGYFTIDLAATYKINRYLSVFARADNLLNRQYENPVGYLQPGRAGYGGITLNY
ncbi:TonB-dependent receptor [Acetobacter farinalis]|uniref:TonB-dependent receptor n=2 Tax=Acetobacter farinalis TaxID=1260984 RepID=A0ABT3Q3D9_9PROT|nr:TonB-dependent receptor [Acetobacter farinalis]MCX2559807.1 TonB-dependent receptor [Acetobacter farinalis]